MSISMKNRTLGEYFGLLTLVITLVSGVLYCYFGMSNNILNSKILLLLVVGMISEAVCFVKHIGLLPLLTDVCLTTAFVLMVSDSIPTFLDYIYNIAMFGGTGQVGLVTAILILMFLSMLVEISSCFMKRVK